MEKPKQTPAWAFAAALVLLVILAMVLLPLLRNAREKRHRYACANNLKQWGLIFRMYADENKELNPPSSCLGLGDSLPGHAVDTRTIFPEYWANPMIAVCPADAEALPFAAYGAADFDDWRERVEKEIEGGTARPRTLHDDRGRPRDSQDVLLPEGISDVGHALLTMPRSYVYLAWQPWTHAQAADLILSKLLLAKGMAEDSSGLVVAHASPAGDLVWRQWPMALGNDPLPATHAAWPELAGSPIDDDGGILPEEYARFQEGIRRSIYGDSEWVRAYYEQKRKEGLKRIVLWDAWGKGGHRFNRLGLATVSRRPGHRDEGCNILFYDGHVEFRRFGAAYIYADGPKGTYGENLGVAMALAAGSVVQGND